MGLALASFWIVLANVLLFAVLTVLGILYARSEEVPRIRALTWALVVVCLAFILSSITRLILIAVRLGWLPGRLADVVGSEWAMLQTAGALVLGILGAILVKRIVRPLRRAEKVYTALEGHLGDAVAMDESMFTVRELQVLETIGAGRLSDDEIAEALFISSSTAATHVRNILKKTGLHNRKDLALMMAANRD